VGGGGDKNISADYAAHNMTLSFGVDPDHIPRLDKERRFTVMPVSS